MFKLVQPLSGELNSQIQLNFIGLSNEAREPAWGNGSGQSLRILIISVSLYLYNVYPRNKKGHSNFIKRGILSPR